MPQVVERPLTNLVCPYCLGRGWVIREGRKIMCQCRRALLTKRMNPHLPYYMSQSLYPSVQTYVDSYLQTKALQSGSRTKPSNLFLLGPSGTGKTTQACNAVRLLSDSGVDCRYMQYLDVVRQFTTLRYANRESDRQEYLSSLYEPSVLFIDDLFSFSPSDYELVELSSFFRRRLDLHKAFILTMGRPLKHIQNLGTSVYRALLETSALVTLTESFDQTER